MKVAKSKSSKWVNDHGLLPHRFEWQEGFGAFSYSKSQVEKVYQYIQNQEIHHRHQSFQEEYKGLLDRFGVAYEEAHLFDTLI
jgi:hypothetical protein